MQAPSTYINLVEYLKAEDLSQIRHEYLNGQVFAMTGGSREHNLITGNIHNRLKNYLRGSRCQVFVSDMKVRIETDNVFYYPDVMVTCNPQDTEKFFLTKPCLIVEVLSPSTENIDRREKLLTYKKIESLQEYILVSQEEIKVELYRKDKDHNWIKYILSKNDVVILDSVNLQLTMTEIYEDVMNV
ncbi:MAG: Uma2 family endonuclease [Chroococcus sp. CMT-3BRIN-NPC107]|jgi:Uma2 family endonuclease|nr:Uma2 family endonuclease [Chroococcus sp. CMT-3BRIN-NPC107]